MTPDEIVNRKTESLDADSGKKVRSSRPRKKTFYDRIDLSKYVADESVIRQLPFILFITLLALLYIWNNHYAIRSIRKVNSNEKEIKQLKWEYLTAKSELEGISKQSEVARLVEPASIRELKTPPVKIYVSDKQGN